MIFRISSVIKRLSFYKSAPCTRRTLFLDDEYATRETQNESISRMMPRSLDQVYVRYSVLDNGRTRCTSAKIHLRLFHNFVIAIVSKNNTNSKTPRRKQASEETARLTNYTYCSRRCSRGVTKLLRRTVVFLNVYAPAVLTRNGISRTGRM